MRIALDSNVLLYAWGLNRHPADGPKIALARDLIDLLRLQADLVVPTQALVEMHFVLARNGVSRGDALAAVEMVRAFALLVTYDLATLESALELSTVHRLQIFDSVILASAADMQCRSLLSEDMQDGFVWGGVELVNPFILSPEATLERLHLES